MRIDLLLTCVSAHHSLQCTRIEKLGEYIWYKIETLEKRIHIGKNCYNEMISFNFIVCTNHE